MIPDPIERICIFYKLSFWNRYIVTLNFQGYTIFLHLIRSQLLSPQLGLVQTFCCAQVEQRLCSFYFYFLHKKCLCTSAASCLRRFRILTALEIQLNWACDVNLTHVDMLNGNQDFAVLQSIFKSSIIIEGYAFAEFLHLHKCHSQWGTNVTAYLNSCHLILFDVKTAQPNI